MSNNALEDFKRFLHFKPTFEEFLYDYYEDRAVVKTILEGKRKLCLNAFKAYKYKKYEQQITYMHTHNQPMPNEFIRLFLFYKDPSSYVLLYNEYQKTQEHLASQRENTCIDIWRQYGFLKDDDIFSEISD